MMRHLAIAAMLFSLAAAAPAAAPASDIELQTPYCAQRHTVVRALADVFAESPVARGAVDDGLIEVFANADSRSWTMILSFRNGISCLLASGARIEDALELVTPGESI
ncbi:MAG: hypothetical protein HY246_01810 [Proteobacteria bacterium]|nr:hypothetical protein [Pseudomonadota bacterium]